MARLTSSPTTVVVTSMPAWRKSMRALTWAKVGNTMNSVNPENNPALNPFFGSGRSPWRHIPNADGGLTGAVEGFPAIVEDWSGGAFHAPTSKLWVHGGGHNGYAGNELISIDLSAESPAWVMERAPTGAIGNTGTLADSREATQVYFDGRPRSSHTYNNCAWVGNDLYHIPAAVFMEPTRENTGAHKLFRFRSDWTPVSTFPSAMIGTAFYGGICHDSLRNRLVCAVSFNRPLQSFNLDGSNYKASAHWTGSDADVRLVYVPTLDVVVILNSVYARKFAVHDFDRTAGGACPQPPASGTPPSLSRSEHYANGVWVPSLGAIAIWGGGTGFHLLSPPPSGDPASGTWAWRRLEASISNAVIPDAPTANGVYGRFFYSPALECLGVVTATDKQVNVFALA